MIALQADHAMKAASLDEAVKDFPRGGSPIDVITEKDVYGAMR